jgi:hypothetical protein
MPAHLDFIVPALQPHIVGRFGFGAARVPAKIDPGGAPGAVVLLRGAVSADGTSTPRPDGRTGLINLFTLPRGMRPRSDRWLTCQLALVLATFDASPTLLAVRASGDVEVKARNLSIDGAVFLDGLSFVAEE